VDKRRNFYDRKKRVKRFFSRRREPTEVRAFYTHPWFPGVIPDNGGMRGGSKRTPGGSYLELMTLRFDNREYRSRSFRILEPRDSALPARSHRIHWCCAVLRMAYIRVYITCPRVRSRSRETRALPEISSSGTYAKPSRRNFV